MLPGGQLPPWAGEQLAGGDGGPGGGATAQLPAAFPTAASPGLTAWRPQQQQQQPLSPLQQRLLQQAGLPLSSLAAAGGFGAGGPAAAGMQQLLVLQQVSQTAGGTMEQAALTALQALGLLPLGASMPGSLQPAVLAPPPSASPQPQLLPPGQPVLLPPGQVGSCPWPVVLAPGFDERQAAAAAEALAAGHRQQQLWQQQAAASALAGVAPAAAGQPAQAWRAEPPIKSVSAMPSTAASPFAAESSVPLSTSWSEHMRQQELQEQIVAERQQQQVAQQLAELRRQHQAQQAQALQQQAQQQQAQQQQAARPAVGQQAAATQPAGAQQVQQAGGAAAPAVGAPSFGPLPLRLPDGSVGADLRALEAMGWSASFASLPSVSADLHSLFQAWQDGRVSLSLAPDFKVAP